MSVESNAARRMPVALIAVLSFLMIVVVALAAVLVVIKANEDDETDDNTSDGQSQSSDSVVVDPPLVLTDFMFTSNTGAPLSLSDLRGKLILLYFGYTNCPDYCPATMLDFKQVQRGLGADAENVVFVLVSVDPQRDTPEVLDNYVSRYGASFIGLQGDEVELTQIAEEYGLFFSRVALESSAANYTVDHTATKYLIDEQGRLVRIYAFGTDPQVMLADVQALLAGS